MLKDTRERALPAHAQQTTEDYLVYLKHLALYEFAKNHGAGKTMLDLGCGEGYGSETLARAARFVVAADNALEVVAHARARYARPNVAFVVCDAQRLPFKPASFDTVISFEVIEHIPDVRRYLEEIKRVAARRVIISTPNRALRLLPLQRPWNRFHLREYDAPGLARALRGVFARVELRGVTATAPILEIEKRRVKQNPFIAYPRMIAQYCLPRLVYRRLDDLAGGWLDPSAQHHARARGQDFSVDDFIIVDEGRRDCINLIAVGEL
jgi:ubiquinone/menaquinone biosynthesis C-methylase UbiE